MQTFLGVNGGLCLRLAETLLHFLWQGALAAALAWGAGRMLRRASAHARYWMYVAALALKIEGPGHESMRVRRAWPILLLFLGVFILSGLEAWRVKGAASEKATMQKSLADVPALIDSLGRISGGDYQHHTLLTSETPATRALEEIGKPAVPALIAALKDPNKHIRRHCAMVLGKIGDPAALSPLIDLCCEEYFSHLANSSDLDNDVYEPASIAVIGLIFPDHAGDMNWIFGTFGSKFDKALKRLGPQARGAIPLLKELLKDPDPMMQQENSPLPQAVESAIRMLSPVSNTKTQEKSRANAAMQALIPGYDPLTSQGATRALAKAYDPITTEAATTSVRIVASRDRLTFQGRDVPMTQLPELLRMVPDRRHTVLEMGETMNVVVSSNLRDHEFADIIRRQALTLTRELGFHHCEFTFAELGTMGSARYEGKITPGRESLVEVAAGTADAPDLIRTVWLRIEVGNESLKARLHGTILSSPHTRWMAWLELFDEGGTRRVRTLATLENSGEKSGGATRDAFDLLFPTDSASETEYYYDGVDRDPRFRLPLAEERRRALRTAGRLTRCKLVIHEIGLPIAFGGGRVVKSTLKVTSQSAAGQMMKNAAPTPARSDERASATKACNTRTISLPVKDQDGNPGVARPGRVAHQTASGSFVRAWLARLAYRTGIWIHMSPREVAPLVGSYCACGRTIWGIVSSRSGPQL